MIQKLIKLFLGFFQSNFKNKLKKLEQINKIEAYRIQHIKEQNEKFRNRYSGKRRYTPAPK